MSRGSPGAGLALALAPAGPSALPSHRRAAPPLLRPARAERRGLAATLGALIVLGLLWLPRPLMIGEFSLSFLVPFALALWALAQPAWPGSVARAVRGGHERGLHLELGCAGLAAAMATLSMLVSDEPLRALRVILPMAYAPAALLLLARIAPLARRRLLYALLFAGALSLAAAMLLAQLPGGAGVMRAYRLLGFFEKPNQLGIAVLAVWPLAIALLLNSRTLATRALCAATLGVLVASIALSGTKTALALGFAAAAAMLLYHSLRSGGVGRTLSRLALALAVIVVAVPLTLSALRWFSPDFLKRVDAILAYGVWNFPSMKTRDVVWAQSIAAGLDHPLLGVGAGTRVYRYSHSHNMLLDYFRGMGVAGLAAAAGLVGCVVHRAGRFALTTLAKGAHERAPDTVVAGLYLGAVFYLLANLLSDSFSPTTAYLFWLVYLGAYLSAPGAAAAMLPRRAPPARGQALTRPAA